MSITNHLANFSIAQDDEQQNEEDVLYMALRNSDINVIQDFINRGFNKERHIRGGWTMLMHACSQGKPEIVEYLLNEGADPKICIQRFTPLMAVCMSLNYNEDELLKCVELLLKYNIDINARDKHGQTAFIFAVKESRKQIIDKLISSKCNINMQDCESKSALFYAVLKGKEEIVKQLVDAGVKLDLIDSEGRTAFDIALSRRFITISKLVMTKEDKEMTFDDSLQKEEYKYKQEPIDNIFNQLPSKNGNLDYSGFPSDIDSLIGGMEMLKLRECFIKHNVQLGEFLTITDQRLKEIGIKFSVHRQHILYGIQKFHLRPWNKSSLGYKATNVPVNIEDGILLMASTVKHLHILKATTQYIRNYIHKPIDLKLYECVEKGLEELKIADFEISKIHSFALDLDKEEKLEPADLITAKVCGSKVTQMISVLILGIFVIGGIVWKNQKH